MAQISVADFLRHAIRSPDRWWHVPNGINIPNPKTRNDLKRMGLTAGVHDLHFIWASGGARQFPNYGTIEMKSPKGSATEGQGAFAKDMAAVGWPTAVCRTVEDVERTLREWGVTLHATVNGAGNVKINR